MLKDHRLPIVDLARSAALCGMVVFHLTYDLLLFGLIDPAVGTTTWFWALARIVAGSFIFLAGLSLWLAHGQGVNWQGFWRRWTRIALAAALVSIATYVAMPDYYVFFGILHAIALYSLIGIVLIRMPPILLLALAAGLVWGAYHLISPTFDAPLLRFLGLSTQNALTVDFEPVFPWLAPFLAGLALGRLGDGLGIWHALRGWPKAGWARAAWVGAVAWPGRHSLAIYLIHQPVLFASLWTYVTLR